MFALSLRPTSRRVLQALLYEALGLAVTALSLHGLSGAEAPVSILLAVVASELALLWNVVFNGLFEAWEARQARRGRSWRRRVVHAVLFEGGLSALTTPALALGLDLPLARAFLYDAALTLIFMAYTYVFTWAFDGVFGLPDSAR